MGEDPTPGQEVARLYEEAETRAARAAERVVAGGGFAELLARMTENVVGVTRIGNDAFDLMLRNLRLAGRRDVIALARQLARTEDKLERVLQELEHLRDELEASGSRAADGRSSSPNARGRSQARRASRS